MIEQDNLFEMINNINDNIVKLNISEKIPIENISYRKYIENNDNDNDKKEKNNLIDIKISNAKINKEIKGFEKDNNNESHIKGDKNTNINNEGISPYKKYINEALYPIARGNLNINRNLINLVDVIGDGNCLFRSISIFVYGTKALPQRVRNEIYNEALNRLPNYPDITLETEHGPMNIRNYVEHIDQDGFYGEI